ncbi:hypothetical protein BP6252_07109 [Coleophoma cylindrospora]|uniref:2EXR domain-containing protein n=1 Tax=Coleophoma cylindrospora TaxID=1849047 RepID=A0A3D8RGP0_9HELO|nr:hypothetical protein BP6252_07109 [Coleophoma cylindrospora]
MPASATTCSQSQDAIVFRQFARLPVEIRHRIFEHLLPPGRIVDVFTRSSSRIYYSPANALLWTTAHRFPSILHVCHDARTIGLKQYDTSLGASVEDAIARVWSHSNQNSQPYRITTLLHPLRDIVYLQDPPSENGQVVVSSLGVLSQLLSPDTKAQLQSLAVPYYNWHKARLDGSVKRLVEFVRLRELYVPVMAVAPDLRDWTAQALLLSSRSRDETEAHTKDVRESVEEDLEALALEFPGWNPPRLTVFRHKGELISDLGLGG